jgi:hypothetical protein
MVGHNQCSNDTVMAVELVCHFLTQTNMKSIGSRHPDYGGGQPPPAVAVAETVVMNTDAAANQPRNQKQYQSVNLAPIASKAEVGPGGPSTNERENAFRLKEQRAPHFPGERGRPFRSKGYEPVRNPSFIQAYADELSNSRRACYRRWHCAEDN